MFAACDGGSLWVACKGVGGGGRIFLPLFSFFLLRFTPLSRFLEVNLHVLWISSNRRDQEIEKGREPHEDSSREE